MTDRDRLIELINQGDKKCGEMRCEECEHEGTEKCGINLIADHLLANGVFILPEDLRGSEDFSISAFIEAMQMYKEKDRYIKPPCKVEDVVYRISTKHMTKMRYIQETKICRIAITKEGMQFFCECNVIAPCVFGKTVFLTKEEAEEKLKEQNNG